MIQNGQSSDGAEKKKPFSGAAANSAQVQIIYLDQCLEEKATLMSDQVGTNRPRSLFIVHAGRALLRRRTQSARCHILSLSCSAPDTALSVNLRWLLCVPLWVFCGSPAAPRAGALLLWVCLVAAARRAAELRLKREASLLVGAES